MSVGICWCLLASDAALRGINERFKVFWIVGGAIGECECEGSVHRICQK